MGLLDDLKKQAGAKQDQIRQQQAELEAQQRYYDSHLQKVMRKAHDYFLELVQQLNVVSPDVSPDYSLAPPNEPPVNLKQDGYVFRSDNNEKPKNIYVISECHLEKELEFYVRSKPAINKYAALLDSHEFPYHVRKELNNSMDVTNATFTLEGPMKVQIRLLASPENKCIYVDLLNVDKLPQRRYKLQPEKVDDALLDRLARMLLREETTLVEVEVSDDIRAELRRKLEEDERRKAEERERALAEAEAERIAEQEAKVINRAKRSVKGSIKKILSKDPD